MYLEENFVDGFEEVDVLFSRDVGRRLLGECGDAALQERTQSESTLVRVEGSQTASKEILRR